MFQKNGSRGLTVVNSPKINSKILVEQRF